MAGRFPTAWVDEVYTRADIVDVVSAYLPLKRQGHNFVGLCPFHNEKSPSFSVNRESNVYHCFGCKAGGNIVQFVMEMERLNYQEALLHLAKQLNIPPPAAESDPKADWERSQKERLYQLNRDAALFYHNMLFTQEGKAVLEYLRERGIDDALIRKFGLGASSAQWSAMMEDMLAKGYTQDELQKAGLIHVKEANRYDVFRNRAMFPIIDQYGNTLGFGARAMGDAQPKYLNTQDTLIFNKRLGVYAINLLRKQRDLNRIILVEGYMDVLAIHQFGIIGAVATLGTAFTNEQARLIKKFAPEVWVAYDGDEAGQNATLRALEILEKEMIPARVLRFPDGLDPDDLLRQRGKEAFEAVKPQSAMSFKLERLQLGFDMRSQEGLTAYSIKACEMLASVQSPLERENHLADLSLVTGFSKQLLLEQLGSTRQDNKKAKSGKIQPTAKSRGPSRERGEEHWAEMRLVALLASGLLPQDLLTPDDFESQPLRYLAQELMEGKQPARILAECDDQDMRSTASELFSGKNWPQRETVILEAEECLRAVRLKRIGLKITSLQEGMNSMDDSRKRSNAQEILRLLAERKALEQGLGNGKDVLKF